MHSSEPLGPRRPALAKQDNLQRAAALAYDTLQNQSAEQLLWLGAERQGACWRLPVLNAVFEVDLAARRTSTSAGGPVGLPWTILALHYLAINSQPEPRPPEITFADLPLARSYAGVYQQRVIHRLCATVGRDAEGLRAAATALGASPVDAGDAGYDFQVFPRVRVRLVWHAPDEEFPPSAALLLPAPIEQCFCSEDIVVLSERLVARLGGSPF